MRRLGHRYFHQPTPSGALQRRRSSTTPSYLGFWLLRFKLSLLRYMTDCGLVVASLLVISISFPNDPTMHRIDKWKIVKSFSDLLFPSSHCSITVVVQIIGSCCQFAQPTVGNLSVAYRQQRDVKVQDGSRPGPNVLGPVPGLGWHHQLSSSPDAHAAQTNVPSLNDLALADAKGELVATVNQRAVGTARQAVLDRDETLGLHDCRHSLQKP